ncbi:maleylpyruvate isomerase N-terminal domain-containing protein [Actinophytocola sp.]|uniref:maleylpyruvate isomerase N-terminal domain-containing protein n=1 Tax=Actinophytocola sp. TaxID=1872138 RepID=UPI0039C897EE
MVDYVAHFAREVGAFEAAVRRALGSAGAPIVPSCPGWSVADLVLHLGGVHRLISGIIRDRVVGPGNGCGSGRPTARETGSCTSTARRSTSRRAVAAAMSNWPAPPRT